MVWCQTLQTNLVTVLISMLDVGRSSSWPYLKRLATFSRYLNWREDRCQRVKALRWKKGVRWGNHARGGLKLNVDASFHSNGTGAAGMILRNDHGEANAGYACPLDQLLNATMAEAPAPKKGLKFIETLGISKIIIESDSLELIQACNSVIEVWSRYSAVLADCFMIAQLFWGNRVQTLHERCKSGGAPAS